MRVRLQGQLRVPGDKSISHRALLFSIFAQGDCRIEGLSPAADCQSTISCLKLLGIEIAKLEMTAVDNAFSVKSPGWAHLHKPVSSFFCGNSGTTMRLMAGIGAGLPFATVFDGDDSLSQRPMSRVLEHLCQMGAHVTYLEKQGYAPFEIKGGILHGRQFHLPKASAQVQTSLLLAGLVASGTTTVSVPHQVRDHTERLLRHIGIPCERGGERDGACKVSVSRLEAPIAAYEVNVPADISSAAFFMVAAALIPGAEIKLSDCGVNPGRTLIVDVLQEMGADISLENQREISGEPVADIVVKYAGRLRGANILASELPRGIDEIPILALAGALADGVFSVEGASELRVKESDRLSAIVQNLRACGAEIAETKDGFTIEGKDHLPGGSKWQSMGDHRLAMTGAIASLVSDRKVHVDDSDCVRISYPGFLADLAKLTVGP
jgi:3-phosphoshikimate 1-carboxyvinyltransferase